MVWRRRLGRAAWRQTNLGAAVHSLFRFYPAYPNGYLRHFLRSYWPCKAQALARLRKEDFGGQILRAGRRDVGFMPAASNQSARRGDWYGWHRLRGDAALCDACGLWHLAPYPKLLAMLRNPIDRLETSYWVHPHYGIRYGKSDDGLFAYATEQIKGWNACAKSHGERRCAFLFEMLNKTEADVFFHCDQLIRGIYWPFIAEWLAAFGKQFLIIRAEDLLSADGTTAANARQAVWAHLGVGLPSGGYQIETRSYAEVHTAGLKGEEPMSARTRSVLGGFYSPHNAKLAAMLREKTQPDWADWS